MAFVARGHWTPATVALADMTIVPMAHKTASGSFNIKSAAHEGCRYCDNVGFNPLCYGVVSSFFE